MMTTSKPSTPLAFALRSLGRRINTAIFICVVSFLAVSTALVVSYNDAATKRADICKTVDAKLDKFSDALGRAFVPADASPAERAKIAAAVATFKADYQASLAKCD